MGGNRKGEWTNMAGGKDGRKEGGEENCNRKIRGGIDGFIRQDDTEVRVHNKNCNRKIRGGIDGFIRQDDTEVRVHNKNCKRKIRGRIDGFIRQDDTEVRVHNKGRRRSGRGQMDDCNEGEDGEEMSDGRERWGGGARHSEVREGMDQCEKEEREKRKGDRMGCDNDGEETVEGDENEMISGRGEERNRKEKENFRGRDGLWKSGKKGEGKEREMRGWKVGRCGREKEGDEP